MIPPPSHKSGVSLIAIEGGLAAIAFAVAFVLPKLGSTWFARIERPFGRLARRKRLSVAVVGLSALLLRLALLPVTPIPKPFFTDDASFLLSADTFLAGRLANPTPVMWTHFETIHETMTPTYASMYFPADGLVMAAGKVLLGRHWYGLLLMSALMCAGICWMLQAWLPPSWALLGGFLAVLRLGLFTYWIDSYTGAGSISALGGALVLGSLPRLMKTVSPRDALLMATGVVLLGLSRPYEGLLLCIPVAIVLVKWAFFGTNRPAAGTLMRRAAIPLALVVTAGAWMGYYDHRAFGSSLTLPYTVDRAEYAVAPYFIWQPQRPTPVYRHPVMREFYTNAEFGEYREIHSLRGFIPTTLLKAAKAFLFFAGFLLLVPMIMVRRVFLDRRIRFLVICALALAAGQVIAIYLVPHYLAPFTVVFYAIGLQAMRHLRVWRPEGRPVGLTLVRLIVTLCVALAGMRVLAEPLHIGLSGWPSTLPFEWYGKSPEVGMPRARIAERLERMPGKQLVIVRYSPAHNVVDEWVYNAPDIDASRVIWAHDMGEAENSELIHHYKDRTVWLVEPDMLPASLTPYSPAEQQIGGSGGD